MLNPKAKKQASCADDYDSETITVETARQKILEKIHPIDGTEKLTLYQSLNRILAEDIVSKLNVPGHTNSAMDGYTLSGDQLPNNETREYRVIGTAYAGRPFKNENNNDQCQAGECVRIMTGAAMPSNTDTVIMQEHSEKISDTTVRFTTGHRKGQNVRQAGEDIAKGNIVLKQGHHLQPADLGVIASIGIGEISVYRQPRIAFFSTGDELRQIGEPLEKGDIYDSNRYSLYGMLSQLNVEIIDLGVVGDKLEDLREAFATASSKADLVITTGGVSVGEADFVKNIIEEMGKIHIWKIAMKPGRPITFGELDEAVFFGLPGNPVAVMTTFYHFVLPAIQKLSGEGARSPLTFEVKCNSALKKRPGRFECLRGILSRNESGQLTVSVTGKQGSGILTSMSRANCLILLDEDCDGVKIGDNVTVQPFNTYL
ncbi:MAG: molybdopterin molybdotransferase MoeA [Gammaproteobacteria bacterium]|nr:molybdopterin molybdotransferase MoeA [Gammaproteobacteria bacterium]